MSNRPLDREETDALKKIASGLRHARADWLGGLMMYRDAGRNIDAMLNTGTNDGEDIIEELTDEDAKGRPWVMGSNNRDIWFGPYILVSGPPVAKRFVCLEEGYITSIWIHTRPLTPEEKARYSK